MKKTFLMAILAALLITACCSAPKPPALDGSGREPVNKPAIKAQLGGTNGR